MLHDTKHVDRKHVLFLSKINTVGWSKKNVRVTSPIMYKLSTKVDQESALS